MMRAFHLWVVLLGVMVLGAMPASPAHAQATKPRVEADTVPGTYIQPEPIWVPVLVPRRQQPLYQGLTVRLHPTPEGRVTACILAPRVSDWVVMAFNANPPSRDDFDDLGKMSTRVRDLITAQAGRGVFRQIEIFSEHQPLDLESQDLTLTCK